MISAMKARLSVAAMLVLAAFALWQAVRIDRLNQELNLAQTRLREAVKLDASVTDPVTIATAQLRHPTQQLRDDLLTGSSRQVVIRRPDGSVVELDKVLLGQKPIRIGPMPAAPGARRPQAEHFRKVILDPASTPKSPGDRMPCGLYGR